MIPHIASLISASLFSWFASEPAPGQPVSPASDQFWLPDNASTFTDDYDTLFMGIMWLSVIGTAGVVWAMIQFCVKYRATSREANEPAESQLDHSNALELAWSIPPLLIVLVLFVGGFKGMVDLTTPPADAYEIQVTGQKWKWLFTYPNGHTDDTLHVPKDKPVRMVINSVDVIHSLYLPSFRTKMDAVPGRYTQLWFKATKAGTSPIFCAEYCGTAHSDMITTVTVHDGEGFEDWLAEAEEQMENKPPAELGELLYKQQGCATCHSIDGSAKTGPTFKGLWGKDEKLADGKSVKVDENYIRESILEPQAKIVAGYSPAMPTYKGKLSDKKINGIIAYMKTLK